MDVEFPVRSWGRTSECTEEYGRSIWKPGRPGTTAPSTTSKTHPQPPNAGHLLPTLIWAVLPPLMRGPTRAAPDGSRKSQKVQRSSGIRMECIFGLLIDRSPKRFSNPFLGGSETLPHSNRGLVRRASDKDRKFAHPNGGSINQVSAS